MVRFFLIALVMATPAAGAGEDTRLLAAQLRSVRGLQQIPKARYAALQGEFVKWIDSRVAAGVTNEAMNAELKAAGLMAKQPEVDSPSDSSMAGFVNGVSEAKIRSGGLIFAIRASMNKSAGCSVDDVVVLYDRKSRRKIGQLTAQLVDGGYPYYLSDIDASEPNAAGERVVATSWTISNCTSTWNGKAIRIDRVAGGMARNILRESLWAQDRDEEANVAARVREDSITFLYQAGVKDMGALSLPGIRRYRLEGDRAIRVAPIALTRVGFWSEWVEMNDQDAAMFAEPGAIRLRKEFAALVKEHLPSMTRSARCPGAQTVWEIAVEIEDGKGPHYLLRIGGARATELRLLSLQRDSGRYCSPADESVNVDGAVAELPW